MSWCTSLLRLWSARLSAFAVSPKGCGHESYPSDLMLAC